VTVEVVTGRRVNASLMQFDAGDLDQSRWPEPVVVMDSRRRKPVA
jgi:hypothetical protein